MRLFGKSTGTSLLGGVAETDKQREGKILNIQSGIEMFTGVVGLGGAIGNTVLITLGIVSMPVALPFVIAGAALGAIYLKKALQTNRQAQAALSAPAAPTQSL